MVYLYAVDLWKESNRGFSHEDFLFVAQDKDIHWKTCKKMHVREEVFLETEQAIGNIVYNAGIWDIMMAE